MTTLDFTTKFIELQNNNKKEIDKFDPKKHNLLGSNSVKIQHSNEFGKGEFNTAIMYLAPYDLSGKQVCPFASAGCSSGCLNTAGRGGMIKTGEYTNAIQNARIRRTRFFYSDRQGFLKQLIKEIASHESKCKAEGSTPAIRLNGTSDIAWETVFPELFAMFPDVIFYDYTKFPINKRVNLPKNYTLTFSRSEANHDQVLENLRAGRNVAIVFSTKKREELPSQYLGYEVRNGDIHDMSFLDPKGVIVGVKAKGAARKDTSGFVVQVI